MADQSHVRGPRKLPPEKVTNNVTSADSSPSSDQGLVSEEFGVGAFTETPANLRKPRALLLGFLLFWRRGRIARPMMELCSVFNFTKNGYMIF